MMVKGCDSTLHCSSNKNCIQLASFTAIFEFTIPVLLIICVGLTLC